MNKKRKPEHHKERLYDGQASPSFSPKNQYKYTTKKKTRLSPRSNKGQPGFLRGYKCTETKHWKHTSEKE